MSHGLSDPQWTPPGVAVFVDSDLRFGRASDVPNVGHARVGSTPRMLSQAPAQWDLVPHLRLLETKDLEKCEKCESQKIVIRIFDRDAFELKLPTRSLVKYIHYIPYLITTDG